jgi:hypothetical protein
VVASTTVAKAGAIPESVRPRGNVPTVWLVVAAGVLGIALVIVLRAIVPLGEAAVLGVGVIWSLVPGYFIARAIYGNRPGGGIAALLVGGVWGCAFSSLTLLALWVAGFRGGWIIFVAPLLALPVAAMVKPLGGRLETPHFTRADLLAVCLLLLLVPLIVGRPFARVGTDLPDGRAYRAYFTADFIWRMAVAAEVSKGDVPPRNQFYLDDPLRYYWLPDLLAAVQYRGHTPPARLEQILLVHSVILDIVFVAFMYALARQLVSSPAAAAAGCVGAILFTSFEGAERIWFLWRHGRPLDALRYFNIDAVENHFYGALKIDGLQRLLWYQPHHAMGYAAGLSALLCATQARDVGKIPMMVWVGTLLACSLTLSTFAALMLVTMTALYVGVRLLSERRFTALVPAVFAGGVPLAAGLAVTTWLQYVDRGETLIQLGLNPIASHGVIASLLLNSPMLATGLIGLWIAMRRRHPYADIFGVIIGVSVLFYFFVDVKDHQHMYVGWRSGHFTFIACAGLTGYALQELSRRGRRLGVATLIVAGLVAFGAAPTTAIDLYNTQDVSNRALGPGFPWTLIVTPDEREALDWIRRNTPPNAIVQVEPSVRDSGRWSAWAFVPAFAERRMAGGLPIGMVPLDKYQAASRRVKEIYTAPDWRTAYDRAKALRIDYLVVGPPERAAYPSFDAMLTDQPSHFQAVVRNGSMTVFHVAR